MANLEEKVKAFLSDEKKIEAIAKDEAFLDAVSAGTATPETIAKEFEKAGLPLSKDEAKQVKETAEKALSTPLEELGEIELRNVSGGEIPPKDLLDFSLGITAAGAVGGLGCWIAGTVCQAQARKAAHAGNRSKSAKLTKAADGLYIATGTFAGMTVTGLAAAKVISAKFGNR